MSAVTAKGRVIGWGQLHVRLHVNRMRMDMQDCSKTIALCVLGSGCVGHQRTQRKQTHSYYDRISYTDAIFHPTDDYTPDIFARKQWQIPMCQRKDEMRFQSLILAAWGRWRRASSTHRACQKPRRISARLSFGCCGACAC